MTKEEIANGLLENCAWDVHISTVWVNDDGRIFLPWNDEEDVDYTLLDAQDWVERCADEDDLLDLTDEDLEWVSQRVTAHFIDRFLTYLIEQLERAHLAAMLNRLNTKEGNQ